MNTKQELYDKYFKDPKGLEQYLESEGYQRLGWQVHVGNSEKLKRCFDNGHMGHQGMEKKTTHDIQHTQTGSDCTYWCTGCKHYWKIDMSG